jgi:hypothetical protein
MLSIIVCSVNEEYLKKLKKNISETIGIEYELLVWDNRESNLGLCRVYNMMAANAKFPLLCFMHEDIAFETSNWGRILSEIVASNAGTAMVGIAGGKYKGRTYSGWFSGIDKMDFYHIFHMDGTLRQQISNKDSWADAEQKVVCIDGILMLITKEAWNEHRFDEVNVPGFHFYDIDLSLRVARHATVLVTNQIDIVHFTKGGDYGDRWISAAEKFHRRWEIDLPFSTETQVVAKNELTTARTWLERLQIEKISFKKKFDYVFGQGLARYTELYFPIIRFFLYRPTGMAYLHKKLTRLKKTYFPEGN